MSQRRQSMSPPSTFASSGLRSLILRYGMANEDELIELENSHQDCMLLESLVREGVSESSLMATIGAALRVKLVSLASLKASEATLVAKFDTRDALAHRYLPYASDKNKIVVAFADPLDAETISRVKFSLEKEIEVVLAVESEIVQLLSKLNSFQSMSSQMDRNGEGGSGAQIDVLQDDDLLGDNVSNSEHSGTMIHLVNEMMASAVDSNTSDIHLEPGSDGIHIKFRQDGVMNEYMFIPKPLQPYITTRIKLLSRMDITERKKPQDGRFRFSPARGAPTDVRASSVPTPSGEKLVLRLLGSADESKWQFSVLGMEPEMEKSLRRLLEIRDRLMIVTGPTGSGKSTTLYTSVYELLRQHRHIVTIEDPVEYSVDGITQIQIDEKKQVGFATCLRSVLRQDPEVIFIGEIRDGETANCALKAAQTGHQVISSLHTSTAPSAIARLIDLGCPPYVVATSTGAVVAQRLVRKLCSKCSELMSPKDARIISETYKIPSASLRKTVGCQSCNFTGYKGREAIFSLFEVTDDMREVIRGCGSEQELRDVAMVSGFRSIAYDGLQKVAQGRTTMEELINGMGLICVEEAALEAEIANTLKAQRSQQAKIT